MSATQKKRGRKLTPEELDQKKAKLEEDHATEWGKLAAGKDASLAFFKSLIIDEGKLIKTNCDGNYAKYPKYVGAMFDGGIFVKMGDVLLEDATAKFDAWADEKNMGKNIRKNHKCALNKFIQLLCQVKEQGLLEHTAATDGASDYAIEQVD